MNIILLILMISTALIAAASPSLLITAACLALFGVIASLYFLLVGAIKLALVQLVIEVFFVIMLVRMAGEYDEERSVPMYGTLAKVIAGFFAFTLYVALNTVRMSFYSMRESSAAQSTHIQAYFMNSTMIIASLCVLAAGIGVAVILRPKGKKNE
jgi:hypothetical protein